MKKQLILSVGTCLIMAMVLSSCDNGVSNAYSVKVIYEGKWSGVVGSIDTKLGSGLSEKEMVKGNGTKTFTVDATYDTIFATISKGNDTKTLTVQIIMNGKVVEEGSTAEPNGTVSITHLYKEV